MQQKLQLNTWTGVLNIFNCILFAASWFIIFGTAISDITSGNHAANGTAIFFYFMAWIGVILNIIALIQSKKHAISLVGPILGLIGNALFGFTALLAFPAIIVTTIGTVFIMLQRPSQPITSNGVNGKDA